MNDYRDEAGAFLRAIGAQGETTEELIGMLTGEFELLKNANEPDGLRHQIYDMLFILFEIASQHEFDLDGEWETGRERKLRKYIDGVSRQ